MSIEPLQVNKKKTNTSQKKMPILPKHNWHSLEIDGEHMTTITEKKYDLRNHCIRTAIESLLLSFDFRRLGDEAVLPGRNDEEYYCYEEAAGFEDIAMQSVDFTHDNTLYMVGDKHNSQVALAKSKWALGL